MKPTLKYTYHVDLQGLDRSTTYLNFQFDRVLSTQSFYLSTSGRFVPPVELDLLKGVNDVKGVVKGSPGDYSSSLINVSGNTLIVKIIGVVPSEIPNIADRIVKRVQRRFAKGEARRRVNRDKVIAEIAALNVRLNGLALLNK
jgi:Holliday junction resolvasome RuvABC ATP-dependent DNA helicase subunit